MKSFKFTTFYYLETKVKALVIIQSKKFENRSIFERAACFWKETVVLGTQCMYSKFLMVTKVYSKWLCGLLSGIRQHRNKMLVLLASKFGPAKCQCFLRTVMVVVYCTLYRNKFFNCSLQYTATRKKLFSQQNLRIGKRFWSLHKGSKKISQRKLIYFYSVSDTSEVMNLLSFSLLPGFFSNLEISAFLTIFLHKMISLLLKYDMMIFFWNVFRFPNFSGFRIFPGYFPDFNLQIFSVFNHICYDIYFGYLYGFKIFPVFSGFHSNLQISLIRDKNKNIKFTLIYEFYSWFSLKFPTLTFFIKFFERIFDILHTILLYILNLIWYSCLPEIFLISFFLDLSSNLNSIFFCHICSVFIKFTLLTK